MSGDRHAFRHNDPGCGGGYHAVYGASDSPAGGPQALVCPLCGAWRPVDDMT